MDFIPDKEFHKIFNRVSKKVNLKGASTPEDVNRRLKQKIKEYSYLSGKTPLAQFRTKRRISHLKNLISAGFGRRTIDEAVANPRGKVALTLKYGREKARDILLHRARRRLGSLRFRKRKRR